MKLDKIASFSSTKGVELYPDYVLYVQLDAIVSLVLSVAYLLLLVYAVRKASKYDISKLHDSIDSEGKAMIAMIVLIFFVVMLFIGLVRSGATIFNASTYLSIFNPEGYILSKAMTGCE